MANNSGEARAHLRGGSGEIPRTPGLEMGTEGSQTFLAPRQGFCGDWWWRGNGGASGTRRRGSSTPTPGAR